MNHDDLLLRLVLAAAAGMALGLERQRGGHAAGARTHLLVAVGACMFTLSGAYGFDDVGRSTVWDPGRIAAQVASGIGFIGAGAILRDGATTKGITTAATLWISAAVGVGMGAGLFVPTAVAVVVVIVALVALAAANDWRDRAAERRTQREPLASTPMATIFHLALASDWAAANEAGAYTVSTRGRTLAEEGFIHASRGDQWPKVRERFYGDVTEPLVLLQIDTDRLDVPVVDEPPAPDVSETFPHIYGPLPVEAVVRAMPLPAAGAPPSRPSTAATGPSPARSSRPGESFGRVFFTEMFFNAALLVLVLAAGSIGMLAGAQLGDAVAPVVGAVAGLVAGAAVARLLYTRRHG